MRSLEQRALFSQETLLTWCSGSEPKEEDKKNRRPLSARSGRCGQIRVWLRQFAWQPNAKLQTVEKYFSSSELADLWGVDTETIRYVFTVESGIVKLDGRVSESRRSRSTPDS